LLLSNIFRHDIVTILRDINVVSGL